MLEVLSPLGSFGGSRDSEFLSKKGSRFVPVWFETKWKRSLEHGSGGTSPNGG